MQPCGKRWYYTFLVAGGTIDERASFAAQVLVYIVENIFLKDDDWKVAALWQKPQRHRAQTLCNPSPSNTHTHTKTQRDTSSAN